MEFHVTYLLIAISVIASLYAWNNPDVYYKWIFNPYDVRRKKQYFRFITSGLIHLDYMHLIFNMLSLFFFGPNVEGYFIAKYGYVGLILFVVLYFSAMVVADLSSYFKHKNDHNYNSLGASGAVSAIVFAAILFNPMGEILVYFIEVKAIIYGVLFLLYSYYAGRNNIGNIGHDAHFYGALYGIAFTIAIYHEVVPHFFKQFGIYL